MYGEKLVYYNSIEVLIYLKSAIFKFKYLFKYYLYLGVNLKNSILLVRYKSYGIITCENLR